MKNKSLIIILSVFMIFVIGCQPTTTTKQTSSSALLPSWISGQSGSVDLTPSAGNPPYKCAVTAGALPEWLKLNGCVLSGHAPVLAGGTTKSLSPEFTVTITDSTGKQQNLGLIVTISTSIPTITFNEPGICIVDQKCSINLINQVTGGTPTYHFQSDTFRNGAPPLGMIVDIDGILTGTPTKAGTYNFGVCVVDVVSVSKCGQTSVVVEEEPEEEFIEDYIESKPAARSTFVGTFKGVMTYGKNSASCAWQHDIDATVTVTVSGIGTLEDQYNGDFKFSSSDKITVLKNYLEAGNCQKFLRGTISGDAIGVVFGVGSVQGSASTFSPGATQGWGAFLSDGKISGNTLTGTIKIISGGLLDEEIVKTVTLTQQ